MLNSHHSNGDQPRVPVEDFYMKSALEDLNQKEEADNENDNESENDNENENNDRQKSEGSLLSALSGQKRPAPTSSSLARKRQTPPTPPPQCQKPAPSQSSQPTSNSGSVGPSIAKNDSVKSEQTQGIRTSKSGKRASLRNRSCSPNPRLDGDYNQDAHRHAQHPPTAVRNGLEQQQLPSRVSNITPPRFESEENGRTGSTMAIGGGIKTGNFEANSNGKNIDFSNNCDSNNSSRQFMNNHQNEDQQKPQNLPMAPPPNNSRHDSTNSSTRGAGMDFPRRGSCSPNISPVPVSAPESSLFKAHQYSFATQRNNPHPHLPQAPLHQCDFDGTMSSNKHRDSVVEHQNNSGLSEAPDTGEGNNSDNISPCGTLGNGNVDSNSDTGSNKQMDSGNENSTEKNKKKQNAENNNGLLSPALDATEANKSDAASPSDTSNNCNNIEVEKNHETDDTDSDCMRLTYPFSVILVYLLALCLALCSDIFEQQSNYVVKNEHDDYIQNEEEVSDDNEQITVSHSMYSAVVMTNLSKEAIDEDIQRSGSDSVISAFTPFFVQYTFFIVLVCVVLTAVLVLVWKSRVKINKLFRRGVWCVIGDWYPQSEIAVLYSQRRNIHTRLEQLWNQRNNSDKTKEGFNLRDELSKILQSHLIFFDDISEQGIIKTKNYYQNEIVFYYIMTLILSSSEPSREKLHLDCDSKQCECAVAWISYIRQVINERRDDNEDGVYEYLSHHMKKAILGPLRVGDIDDEKVYEEIVDTMDRLCRCLALRLFIFQQSSEETSSSE